jgi:thiosulfate dehydrogenase (quinone) large subunit
VISITPARERPRAIATLRVAFGLIWSVDAFLKWQPAFRRSFSAMVIAVAQGQPSVLQPWFALWGHLVAGRGEALSLLTALTETALAVGLVAGVARRLTYTVGAVYALMVWSVAEGFGGPYVLGTTPDVGAALIYAVLFVALLLLEAGQGTGAWSVDAVLRRHPARWRHLATWGPPREVRPSPPGGGTGSHPGVPGVPRVTAAAAAPGSPASTEASAPGWPAPSGSPRTTPRRRCAAPRTALRPAAPAAQPWAPGAACPRSSA